MPAFFAHRFGRAYGPDSSLRSLEHVACPYLPDAFAAWARAEGVTGVILEAPYWSPEVVACWRAAGLSLMCGAVNDATLLERVLPLGPDAVSTDRPHELRQEIASLLGRD